MNRIKPVLAAFFALFALAAAAAELREGRDYKALTPPLATEEKAKIEVVEFFWYGCGHCFNFEPILAKWVKRLPADVSFRKIPAVFPGKDGTPGGWAPGARIFYALEALGLLDKLHGEVFDAIHIDRVNLNDEKVLADWMGKKGVDVAKFMDAYKSFAVQSKVGRSMQLSVAAKLEGVPAVIVDGRFMPASGSAGSHEETTAVIDKLIDKVRRERAGRK